MSYTKIYQQTKNFSANNPLESVATLLESAAKHVAQAKIAIETNQIETRFLATEKACSIITGLMANLSDNPQTESAKILVDEMHAYYAQVLVFLTDINMQNDPTLCEKVIIILNNMANVWHHAAEKAHTDNKTLAPQNGPFNQEV